MTHMAQGNLAVSRWRGLSVRTRLMSVHVMLMSVVIGAIVVQSDHVLTARLNSEFNRDLTEEGAEFTNAASTRPRGQALRTFSRFYLDQHVRPSSLTLFIAVNRPRGIGGLDVLVSPDANPTVSKRIVGSLLETPARSPRISSFAIRDTQYRARSTPIVLSGQRVATLVAVRDLEHLNAQRSAQLTIIRLEGLAALIAAVIAGYLLLRRVLRVVSDVTGAAEHAAGGDLSLRLGYRGRDDEVGQLARTVDTMLDRVDAALSAQRRLLSDVSHQLRTPLTVIRGHLAVLATNPEPDDADRAQAHARAVDQLAHVSHTAERLPLLHRRLDPDLLAEDP